jgi:ethanolamine utilization protein EutQ (cupin superfamily)
MSVQIAEFDPARLEQYVSHGGRYVSWEALAFDEPGCVAAFSVKRRADDLTAPWSLWNDEVWYVVEGEMELTWSSPPMFNDEQRALLRPGMLVLLPVGTQFRVGVLGEQVRFVWVTMPRPRHFGAAAFFSDAHAGA